MDHLDVKLPSPKPFKGEKIIDEMGRNRYQRPAYGERDALARPVRPAPRKRDKGDRL